LRGGEAFGGLGSASWHEVYNQPNVELVDINDTPIESITPSGIKTSDCEFDCMTSAISDAVPILAAPVNAGGELQVPDRRLDETFGCCA
jgi:hypothetical protein